MEPGAEMVGWMKGQKRNCRFEMKNVSKLLYLPGFSINHPSHHTLYFEGADSMTEFLQYLSFVNGSGNLAGKCYLAHRSH